MIRRTQIGGVIGLRSCLVYEHVSASFHSSLDSLYATNLVTEAAHAGTLGLLRYLQAKDVLTTRTGERPLMRRMGILSLKRLSMRLWQHWRSLMCDRVMRWWCDRCHGTYFRGRSSLSEQSLLRWYLGEAQGEKNIYNFLVADRNAARRYLSDNFPWA